MKSIHICHISQSAGGVETYILHILRHSDKQRFRHTVICSDNGTLAQTAKEAGAEVVNLPLVGEISPRKDLFGLVEVWRALRRLKPDLIHAHSAKGGFFGRLCGTLLGTPVIYAPNGFSFLGQAGFRRWLVLTIEKALSYTHTLLLATSPSEAKRAIAEVGWPSARVSTQFPNSVEVHPAVPRSTPNETIRVLMIGRLCYQKNPEMFLRVALRAGRGGKISFTILGAGYASWMEERVRRMMLEEELCGIVEIKPWCDAKGVQAAISNSDIYISTSRYEGFSYCPVEAMERGLPVIATRIDGNVDLVEEGENGFLVEVDDDDSMAAFITRLAEDSKLRERMGKAARDKVAKNYNIEKNIKKLEDIYQSLTKLA